MFKLPVPEVSELDLSREEFLALLEEKRAQYRSEEEE